MEWSWTAWGITAGATALSGAIACWEGNWTRRVGLGMGFANHGGMWGDLVLLPMANAAVAPHLDAGPWIVAALAASILLSLVAHKHWYDPQGTGDHMWPAHARGAWWRDLSWAGWAHVAFVAGQLTLVAGFALHSMSAEVVIFVAAILTIHVPVGLLQPHWYLTGHIATAMERPLLLPCLLAVWIATGLKL